MNKSIFIYIIFLLLFRESKTGEIHIIDNILSESKYNDYYYLNTYKIPLLKMNFKANGDEIGNHPLIHAFDNNFNTYWESYKYQEDNFLNNIEIIFSKTVTIDRMVYQAYSNNKYQGIGYPTELKIYYKLKNTDNILESDYLLIDDIISERTGNRVLFIFENQIFCDQIKLEWADIEQTDSYYLRAFANEIIFLAPENEYLNKLIFEVFEPNDYFKLNINPEYKDLKILDELENQLKEYSDIFDNIKELLTRARKIIKGEIKYDKRRLFTTCQDCEANILNQHGDISYYSKTILKMSRGGTNKQSTGIFGFSNETITILVEGNNDDPLPKIRFSQYLGLYNKWIDLPITLTKGINIFNISEFDTSEIEVNVKSGGPIYIENNYSSDKQSQNIKVYIDGGTLFPLFRINDDESIFKKNLNEYIIELNKNRDKFYDICELYSDKISITVNATYAHQIYNIQGESPQENLISWDKLIKILYIFEGIQFEENEPYYDPKNEFINLHIRYATNHNKSFSAFACDDHIGIFYKNDFYYSLVSYKGIGSTLVHEIGHMIDVKPREYAEITNCVLEEYAVQTMYKEVYHRERQATIYGAIAPDNIDNSLRYCKKDNKDDCKGFFVNAGLYEYNQYIWWNIESFYPGYWRKLNNLYRFNSSLIDRMSKNEGMVFLTNLILGFDTGYYFERFGLAMSNNIPFNISSTSLIYNNSMKEAINQGKIVNYSVYKKLWYADDDQYNYSINNGTGCYEDINNYDIKITNITKKTPKIIEIHFSPIDCEGHLGFEVIENDLIIGFTQNNYFVEIINYPEGNLQRYKIRAYDRLLNFKESEYFELIS